MRVARARGVCVANGSAARWAADCACAAWPPDTQTRAFYGGFEWLARPPQSSHELLRPSRDATRYHDRFSLNSSNCEMPTRDRHFRRSKQYSAKLSTAPQRMPPLAHQCRRARPEFIADDLKRRRILLFHFLGHTSPSCDEFVVWNTQQAVPARETRIAECPAAAVPCTLPSGQQPLRPAPPPLCGPAA